MSENAPVAPAPPPVPQPSATAAPAAPPGDGQKPTKALDAAVRRTVALKGKEAELAKREEALKPILELEALAKSNPAEAFKRLTGEGFLEAYKSITNDVVGSQDEAAALAALPKTVQEKLARLEALEKQGPVVEALEKRLGEIEKRRLDAETTLVERQKQEVATRVYSAGFEAVKAVAAELPLLLAHPEKDARLQARWVGKMKGVSAELASMKPEQRQQKGAELVLEAAREEQAALEAEIGWVLQTPWARGKMAGVKGGAKPTSSAPAVSASTQATPKPPRTGTPGSLGEPSAPDLRKMTHTERIRHLSALERAGTLFKKP
jgi:hypothetical protein